MSIEDWRREIDEIDFEIVRLLNRRIKLCEEIGKLKREMGLPLIDVEREKMIFRNALLSNQGYISDSTLLRIFCEILSESRKVQMKAIV
jgi:chorismate mutase